MSVKSAVDQMGRQLPIFDLGASQNRTYNAAGGSALQSSAFGATTYAIMIAVELNSVRIAIGIDPTATATSTKLLAPGMYIFSAPPGGKISVLGNSGVGDSINVTEIIGNPTRGIF